MVTQALNTVLIELESFLIELQSSPIPKFSHLAVVVAVLESSLIEELCYWVHVNLAFQMCRSQVWLPRTVLQVAL